MSKPSMEQLEQGVSALIKVLRRLKDENERLRGQAEDFRRKYESLGKEKELIKDKLERLRCNIN